MNAFAICTSTWPEDQAPDRFYAEAAELGFSGVELLGEPKQLDLVKQARSASASGLTVTALTASGRLPTGRDLAHPDASVRLRTREHYRECIAVASEIGAPIVGIATTAVGRPRPLATPGEEREWIREAIFALQEIARVAGVRLAVEILNRYVACQANTVATALELLAPSDPAVVGVCVDLFHANIEERDPEGCAADAGERLVNFHVADSNRLGIGHGHLNFVTLVRALSRARYLGPLALEAVPSSAAIEAAGGSALPLIRQFMREFRPRLERAQTQVGSDLVA